MKNTLDTTESWLDVVEWEIGSLDDIHSRNYPEWSEETKIMEQLKTWIIRRTASSGLYVCLDFS